MKSRFYLLVIVLLFLIYKLPAEVFVLEYVAVVLHNPNLTIKFVEKDGIMYFNNGSRLNKFKDLNTKNQYNIPYTAYYTSLTSFAIDKNNKAFVGTEAGLFFDDADGNQTNPTIAFGVDIGIPVYSVECDLNNKVWISTSTGIWTILNNELNHFFPIQTSEIKDTIRKIVVDSSNFKWFITKSGVYKYDNDKVQFFDSSNSGLPNNKITTLKIDKNGVKWFGTYNGLAKFDDINWTIYNTKNTNLPNDTIMAFDWDSLGVMWIGTYHGFGSFENESNFTLEEPYLFLTELVIDKLGNKWYSRVMYNSDAAMYELDVLIYHKGGVIYTGVDESEVSNQVIFPNPVYSSFSLSEIPNGSFRYEIYDNLGIKRSEGLLGKENDVSFLPSGIYFLKLNNQVIPIKFLKVK